MPSYPSYNKLMSLRLRRMARYGSIFKVLHADPVVIDATPDTDMVLYVLYSLNKQRRWEIQDFTDNYMEFLQEVCYQMDVMVLERQLTDPFTSHWAHILPHFAHILNGAKVTTMHSIQKEPWLVSHQNFGGKGRFVNKTRKKPENHEANGMELVTYNIVQAPKNYKKIFENKFKNYKRTKDSTYHRKGAFDPMSTKIDLDDYKSTDVCSCCPRFDYKGLNVDYDSDTDKDELSIDTDKPSEFYNLTDHIIASKRSQSHKKPKTWVWI